MKDKKNRNKGFTLVELLAVVVILLAISIMAISSISAAIERNKAKQDETKKEVLISYAKLYYDEHKNTYSGITTGQISVSELRSSYDLTEDETKDPDGNPYNGCIEFDVSISSKGTKRNNWKYVAKCS